MGLTRAALREKGIAEKEILDYIMEEHGAGIETAKEKAKEATESTMQKTIDTLQAKVDSMPKDDGEDWKSKHDTLKAKYDADVAAKNQELSDIKAAHESEKTDAAKQSVLRKQLAADGANPKLVDLLELKFDLAAIELDGDKIKNWENICKPVKEQYADVFGKVTTQGALVAAPPANDGGKPDYKTQLEEARKSGNTQESVRIKTEAAKEGVFLI